MGYGWRRRCRHRRVPLLAITSDLAGWRIAFIAAGAVAASLVGFLITRLPKDAPTTRTGISPRTLIAAHTPLLRHLPILRLYGITVLRALTWAGMIGYFGAHLGNELEMGASWIGVACMLGGGGYLTGSLVAGRILERRSPRLVIALASTAMAASLFVMFTLTRSPAIATAMLIVAGIGDALCLVATVTLLQAETPAGSGTTMGLNTALMNLGSACGGAIGGTMLAMGGYRMLGLGLPLVALMAALLLMVRITPVSASHREHV